MELDSIKKIVQAEKEAEQIKTQARQRAEKTIKNAIESEWQKEKFAKTRCDYSRERLEEKAKVENVDTISKISEMTATECEEIEQKAKKKMQVAVDAIFKEVIS